MQTTVDWQAAQSGEDPAARDALMLEHLRLVKHVVSQMMRTTSVDVEFDDLVSAGTVGLMEAVDNFDPSRGLAFSTFAAPRIRGSILDDLRRRDHVPRSVRRKQRDLSRARERLSRVLGRPPSADEMARELEIDIGTYWSWRRDVERSEQVSLDRPVDPDGRGGTGVEEFVADESDLAIDERLTRHEEIELLRDEILGLTERERLVLALYYFEELKLREIAEMIGVTESRVSQIRSKAIGELRSQMHHLREAPR